MAPKGFAIRMMEPGEGEALRALLVAGLRAPDPPLRDFATWLVRHEVFVAEAADGGLAGFAAARDALDLYWLSALAVAPDRTGQGVRAALLRAVEARAGWFFHRAVGLAVSADDGKADWYRRHRYVGIERRDWTPALAALVGEEPGRLADGILPAGSSPHAKTLMVHWL